MTLQPVHLTALAIINKMMVVHQLQLKEGANGRPVGISLFYFFLMYFSFQPFFSRLNMLSMLLKVTYLVNSYVMHVNTSTTLCDWICEKGPYMCNYKYLEIQFWNIQFENEQSCLHMCLHKSIAIQDDLLCQLYTGYRWIACHFDSFLLV